MACDDLLVLVDQERVHEAELPQRAPQLHDLLVAVFSGVVFIWLDLRNRNDIEFFGDLHVFLQKQK